MAKHLMDRTKTDHPPVKKHRLISKQEHTTTQVSQRALGGDSYQFGKALAAKYNSQVNTQDPTIIALDLETTDLIRENKIPHITQISAAEVEGQRSFNKYVIPKQPIAIGAQQITGMVFKNGKMTVHGQQVEPVDIQTALQDLITWLEMFPNTVIMAHYGKLFDFPVLLSAMSDTKLLDKFENCVIGCVDSLSIFRKCFPNRKTYKQQDLVHDLLNVNYKAHEAQEDVRTLRDLFKLTDISISDFMKFTFSPKAVQYKI